jgi:hypothetical protein
MACLFLFLVGRPSSLVSLLSPSLLLVLFLSASYSSAALYSIDVRPLAGVFIFMLLPVSEPFVSGLAPSAKLL